MWFRRKRRVLIDREVVEQATAAPGEKRDVCPRCKERMGPGHESYPCVRRG